MYVDSQNQTVLINEKFQLHDLIYVTAPAAYCKYRALASGAEISSSIRHANHYRVNFEQTIGPATYEAW